jgi:PAS domain S-box-containing protein
MIESEGFCQSSSPCESEAGMAGRKPADGVGLQADSLRALVESPVTSWFLADRERFLDFNHGFVLLAGYGRTELAALAPNRLFPHQWSHHPSTTDGEPFLHFPLAKGDQGEFPFPTGGWNEVAGSLLTLIDKGEMPAKREAPCFSFETRITTKFGTERWVAVKAAPFARADRQAFLAHVVDITSYKEREEALRRSEMRYRKVFEFAPDAIFIHDPQGSGLDGNQEAFSLLGGSSQDKAPDLLTVMESLHEDDKARFPEIQKQTLERGEYRGEFRAYKKDGQIIDIETRVKVADIGSETVVIAITRDISERKRMEEQIRNSLQEKEMLLREIHHRVKNNMQIISTLLKLQLRNAHDEKTRALFRESQNRILSMAMIHEKLYQSEGLLKINLNDYIGDLAEESLASFGTDGAVVALRKEVDDIVVGLDAAIPCGLIVIELLSNALKYAFPDKRAGEIVIALHAIGGNRYQLTVSDNGVGLPPHLDIGSLKSLGLRLVSDLARYQLEGELELLGDSGTTVTVRFQERLAAGEHQYA